MDQETWEANTGDIQATMDLVSKAAAFRRDSWISKEAALTYFFQRYPWNTWSPRIVQLYAVCGKDIVNLYKVFHCKLIATCADGSCGERLYHISKEEMSRFTRGISVQSQSPNKLGSHCPCHGTLWCHSHSCHIRRVCGPPVRDLWHCILSLMPYLYPLLFRPAVVRDCVVDTSKNRNVTSVTRIPDVGHMVCSCFLHPERYIMTNSGHR